MYISLTIIGLLGLFLFLLFGYVIYLKDELKNTTLNLTKERDQKAEEANAARRALMSQEEHYEARLALTVAIYDHVALLQQEKGLPCNYTLQELCRIIYTNRNYCNIAAPSDISRENIERIIKVSLFAEAELLDYCSTPAGKLVRLVRDGSYVPLSDQEFQQILQHDYDFILNDPRNNV